MPNDLDTMLSQIDRSIEVYKSKVDGVAQKINRVFWTRIVFLSLALIFNVLVGLGWLDGFQDFFDWSSVIGLIGLDATGIAVSYNDIKEVVKDKTSVANNFARSIELLESQRQIFSFISDDDTKLCAIQHLGKMFLKLKDLITLDLDDKGIEDDIETLVDNVAEISRIDYTSADYCQKVEAIN